MRHTTGLCRNSVTKAIGDRALQLHGKSISGVSTRLNLRTRELREETDLTAGVPEQHGLVGRESLFADVAD